MSSRQLHSRSQMCCLKHVQWKKKGEWYFGRTLVKEASSTVMRENDKCANLRDCSRFSGSISVKFISEAGHPLR